MFIDVLFFGINIHIVSTPDDARLLAQVVSEPTIVPNLPNYLLLENLLARAWEMFRNHRFDLWRPVRQWIDRLPIDNQRLAHQICELVPAQCPFERDLTIFGHCLIRIPPLCKINPLYEELVALRWRALCYLADQVASKLS